MQFTVKIYASRKKVWDTLWQDTTFREWAGIIDEGTYLAGELKEGNEVQFISSVNGYGVTSLVDKLVPNEHIVFRHMADTKDRGATVRDKDWTGGTESHTLTEVDGVTTLTVEFEVPTEMEEIFKDRMPKALECAKALAESKYK